MYTQLQLFPVNEAPKPVLRVVGVNGCLSILVGCEESQAVCIELRKLGHEAFSCDILPCSGGHPEWHLQMDVFEAIDLKKWDIIIIHPPCTCVCVSGNRTYAVGKPKHNERVKAAKWTEKLWKYATKKCDFVAMENPVGCLNTMCDLPKPQYIQPYEYGHPETKKTGLWLHNLPKLKPTEIVKPEYITGKDGNRYSRIHYLSSYSAQKYYGCDRATVRSRTYPGIAAAIAIQWTNAN